MAIMLLALRAGCPLPLGIFMVFIIVFNQSQQSFFFFIINPPSTHPVHVLARAGHLKVNILFIVYDHGAAGRIRLHFSLKMS